MTYARRAVNGLINLVQFPMFVCSGVFFSTARFPDWMQKPLRVLPLTALNDAMRAVMIDGAGPRAVAGPGLVARLLAAEPEELVCLGGGQVLSLGDHELDGAKRTGPYLDLPG